MYGCMHLVFPQSLYMDAEQKSERGLSICLSDIIYTEALQTDHWRRLRGTGGTVPPKFEVGNGPCIRSPNIWETRYTQHVIHISDYSCHVLNTQKLDVIPAKAWTPTVSVNAVICKVGSKC